MFVRPDEPTQAEDDILVGDAWVDMTTNSFKRLIETAPTAKWYTAVEKDETGSAIASLGASGTPSSSTFLRGDNTWAVPEGTGGGGGGATVGGSITYRWFMFQSGTANTSMVLPAGGTGAQYSTSNDVFADLTDVTDCRVFARGATSTATIWIKYSTDLAATSLDLGTTANTPAVSVVSVDGQGVGAWTPIASGAKTFVRLGYWAKTSAGSGETVTLRNIGMVCRTAPIGGGVASVSTLTTPFQTTATTEQDAFTYTIPANTLSADGRGLRITFNAGSAPNANTKTLKFYVNGTAITLNTTTTAPNGSAIAGQIILMRTGASTEIMWAQGVQSGVNLQGPTTSTSLTEDTTADIPIKITLTTPTATGDLTLRAVIVEPF